MFFGETPALIGDVGDPRSARPRSVMTSRCGQDLLMPGPSRLSCALLRRSPHPPPRLNPAQRERVIVVGLERQFKSPYGALTCDVNFGARRELRLAVQTWIHDALAGAACATGASMCETTAARRGPRGEERGDAKHLRRHRHRRRPQRAHQRHAKGGARTVVPSPGTEPAARPTRAPPGPSTQTSACPPTPTS